MAATAVDVTADVAEAAALTASGLSFCYAAVAATDSAAEISAASNQYLKKVGYGLLAIPRLFI